MKNWFIVIFLSLVIQGISQVSLDYYLPNGNYNPDITTPEEFLGFQVGEWHISHDQLYHYCRQLASESDRVQLIMLGRSHERRPVIALAISSEDNIKNLESIRQNHINLTESESDPVIVWQGYSIHGNEASGANAGVLYAYHLTAARDAETLSQLEEAVVLYFPSFNPDGFNRFASWVNVHKNKNITSDSRDREYDEAWPRGRTNHYWFDLNRDWLPLTQPTSVAKNELFRDWRPNVLTDHHEMGTNATFFFQPGIPARTHPLTPSINQELTAKIGQYHADFLDKIGSLYFTEENYDDFYYGKGSTFPDIQGTIGILFEQASSRGHSQESDNGILTFPFTIKNQLTTSFSTLTAAIELKSELFAYQKSSYQKKRSGSYTVGTLHDYDRLKIFADLLEKHRIEYHFEEKSGNLGGKPVKYTLQVSTDQTNGALVEAMFDTRTTFNDSLFYDVSAFNMAQSFGFAWQKGGSVGSSNKMPAQPLDRASLTDAYAYLVDWHDYYAPEVLFKLLENDYLVKVATSSFTSDGKSYKPGTLLVPTQGQDLTQLARDLKGMEDLGIEVTPVKTGMSLGKKLGSYAFRTVEKPSIAVAVGSGVSSYDAGEIWHLLDQVYNIPITKIDISDVRSRFLEGFTVFILPDGNFSFSESQTEYIKDWATRGGVVIGFERATSYLQNSGLSKSVVVNSGSKVNPEIPYDQMSQAYGAQVTGGAIIGAHIDLTHPLMFGMEYADIPVFKRGNAGFEVVEKYKNPLIYSSPVLLNGYLHPRNREFLAGKSGIQVSAAGQGRIISAIDNYNFRAFWKGNNKILANMIFFGDLISGQSCVN